MENPSEQPTRAITPLFSQPLRQIISMVLVLALTGLLTYVALPQVFPVFKANPWLNGFIALVFLIGVIACFTQVFSLISSVRWIEGFAAQNEEYDLQSPPQLLAPLATLLRSRRHGTQISASSTQSILDSLATRIDEAREFTRYIVNMLIFLGLLGTFYGLATTVPAIVETIQSLAPQENEGGVDVFSRLMTGLESQLGGMGIAFASSLLGLAGSLIVGLLELFAGHGQNRFYRELEEWLSSITRLGYAGADGDTSHGAIAGVLDLMGEQMEALQVMFAQADESRGALDDKLNKMTEAFALMAARMEENTTTNAALMRVADGQERLMAALEDQARQSEGLDAESRMRLRSMDVQLLRILEEISSGRQETTAELRTDIAALGRALTAAKER